MAISALTLYTLEARVFAFFLQRKGAFKKQEQAFVVAPKLLLL